MRIKTSNQNTFLKVIRDKGAALTLKRIDEPIRKHPKRAITSSFASGLLLGAGVSFLFGRRRSGLGSKERKSERLQTQKDSVGSVMTRNPAICTPESTLDEVARKMVDYDCGAIPVVENEGTRRPIGMITDRDIVARAVTLRRNLLDLTVRDCMTPQALTVSADASIEECCWLMEEYQVRRIPVVDMEGHCVGIVAQADIATYASPRQITEVVREVSRSRGNSRAEVATAI